MKENQKFVFEKNRYYSGKMLTSADFLAEQEYISDRHRFINRVMFGSGIVWGGGVYNLDDLSVMVESGAFIDTWGREIIIPQAEIKKLSAIDGFDSVTSGTACLCVSYDEENINPVYAVRQGEERLEHNHVREGYRLVLIDERDMEEEFSIESEFLTEGEIFNNNDYSLKIIMPAVVCKGRYVKICFELKKLSETRSDFSFSGVIQMPSFTIDNGGHEYFLEMQGEGLKRNETVRKELWVKADDKEAEAAKVILKPGTVKAYIDGQEAYAPQNPVLDIAIENTVPLALVDSIIGRTSLEMRTMVTGSRYVSLAKISFENTDQGYMITGIEERSVKKYIEAPADETVRRDFLNYFRYERNADRQKEDINENNESFIRSDMHVEAYSGGAFEIPLGKGAKKGEVFFSDNIVCGKKGEVMYVQLGFDVCEQDNTGQSFDTTIFGESSIFREQNLRVRNKEVEIPIVASAVKLCRDRGTFQAGVRFLRDYNQMLLKGRWIAVKRQKEDTASEGRKGGVENDGLKKNNGYIAMEKPTIIMKPHESIYLKVLFNGMEPCPVTYAINEYGSGEVTENGVYTAPKKEGIFEVNVYCTDNPVINTFCFIVVKN